MRLYFLLNILCIIFLAVCKYTYSVLVEDHKLFSVYDNVLSANLISKVREDALKASKWTTSKTDTLEYGKRSTFWFKTNPPQQPRSSLEKAVLELARYALPDIYNQRPNDVIIGGEWWLQVRSGTETIGFHYDKDEAMASIQMKMKHPLISTVTYLSDIGAPTLIFNQTTDGNNETPEIPDLGFISYPKFNRHITFSGDLQHGVLGSASSSKRVAEGRITLLINWWDVQPMEPNTIALDDEDLQDMGIYDPNLAKVPHVSTDIKGLAAKTLSERIHVPVLPISIPDAKRHDVEIPPGDHIFAYLPKTLSSGAHELRWEGDQIYGNIGILDLKKRNQVDQLFRLPEPKVLFMYNPSGKKGKQAFEDFLKVIAPLAKKYVKQFKTYFVPTSTAKDVLPAFGVDEKDLPLLAIDDTKAQKKYIQPKSDFSYDKDKILAFLEQHIDLEDEEQEDDDEL